MNAKNLTDGQGNPMSYEEIDYLKELAASLPRNPVIVNIGADVGVSTCAFLEERKDATIYSIDVLPCEQEFEHVKQCGLPVSHLFRLLGNSREIGPSFPFICDLLFIDGDHFGAGEDIRAWVETGKVRAGGIVALHDFIVPPNPENNPGSVFDDVGASVLAEYEQLGWYDRVVAFRVPE